MRINAQNRVILQTQEPDASVYARQFAASGVTAADISQQDPTEHQYAALLCGGQRTGLFSLRPLPWPAPVAAAAPADAGPDWRTVLPAAAPDPAYDRQVLRLVYGAHPDPTVLGLRLATHLTEREWQLLQDRWNAIRLTQRAYIVAHPGCIPDRLERQRWLSRLLVARPRLLAEIDYHRQRPAITVAVGGRTGGAERASRDAGRPGRGGGDAAPVAAPETWATQATTAESGAQVDRDAPAVPLAARFLE
jgi:hypothetical protein